MELLTELQSKLKELENLPVAKEQAKVLFQKGIDFQQTLNEFLQAVSRFVEGTEPPRAEKNEKSLHEVLHEVLASANQPLTVAEACELAIEAGYKTKSRNKDNFRSMVNMCFAKHEDVFRRVTRKKTRPIRYGLRTNT